MPKETWSVTYSVVDLNNLGKVKIEHFSLDASGNADAKQKVLDAVQKRARRVRQWQDKFIHLIALPELRGKDSLNGNRMLRIKRRFRGKALLRLKNPEIPFVQGYGSRALRQVEA